MKLIQTTFFSALVTFVRISSGFVVSKLISVYTGPAGVASIGALINFVTLVLSFANGGINTGVVKYTAEYEAKPVLLKSFFSTSLKITIYCSAFSGIVIILLAPYCSKWIFNTSAHVNVIRVLGITLFLYSLNALLIAILNGKGQIKTYTIVNTVSSIISLCFTMVLVYFYKISGALYALVLAQSIVFFVTATLIFKSQWFSWDFFNKSLDRDMARKLGQFSLMALVSAITVPLSQIILRNLLIKELGIDSAGYWQGMMRISEGYLMIITTSLSTYYLPKLSSISSENDLRKEITGGLKLILPAVLVGCFLIFHLRSYIIKILYTEDFLPMSSLFLWQLAGDFFKIAAILIGYLMIAKAMTRYYIATEIIFNSTYILFGYLFVDHFGLNGITMAFAFNYLCYLIVITLIFRKLLFNYAKSAQ